MFSFRSGLQLRKSGEMKDSRDGAVVRLAVMGLAVVLVAVLEPCSRGSCSCGSCSLGCCSRGDGFITVMTGGTETALLCPLQQ